MKDDDVLRAELARHFSERWQEGFKAIINVHGGMEGWHAACRARREADPDNRMARIICRLIRWRHTEHAWTLNEHDERCLRADRPLAAYFDSVADAGDSGWREERARVAAVAREAAMSDDPGERLKMLDVEGVKCLLPMWRAWGQVLIDAREVSTSQPTIT